MINYTRKEVQPSPCKKLHGVINSHIASLRYRSAVLLHMYLHTYIIASVVGEVLMTLSVNVTHTKIVHFDCCLPAAGTELVLPD